MPRNAALAAVLLLAAARAIAQDDPRNEYEPLRGMDRNGRITRPAVPADLPNHPRWRYTPPGRIKPGNVLERFLVSSFVSPIIFREQDIGFGGGFALTDVDFRNQRYREFANILVTYSAEGQQAYRINWSRWLHVRDANEGGVWREERNRVFAHAGYSKTLTRRFYGFGSRTLRSDETSYTEELTHAGLGVRVSLPDPGSDWLVRTDIELARHGLARGAVLGRPSTDDVFAGEFRDGDGVDQVWWENSAGFDSRDSLHQAYRGSRLAGLANVALGTSGQLGAIVGLDAQHTISLPPLLHRGGLTGEENPPTDVLAVGAFVHDTVGDLPYYSLPNLGGTHTLRGYIQNRFTDRAAAAFTAEYRLAIVPRGITFTDTIRIERIGLAFFYDGGTVASGVEKLLDARYHDSYGIGLRFAFAREALFRADIGYSDEGSIFTLAFGNSF